MLGAIILHPTSEPPQPTPAPKDECKLQENNSNIKQLGTTNLNTSPPYCISKFYRKSSHIGRSRSVSVSGKARAGDIVHLPRVKKKQQAENQQADNTPERTMINAAPTESKAGILNFLWRKVSGLFVTEPVASSQGENQGTKARADGGVSSTSLASKGRQKSPVSSRQRPKPLVKRTFLLAPVSNLAARRLSPLRGKYSQPRHDGKLGSPRSARPGKKSDKRSDQRLERARKYERTLSELEGQGKEPIRSSQSPLRPSRGAGIRRAASLPSVRSWQEDDQTLAHLSPKRVRSELKKKTRERGDVLYPATRPTQLSRRLLSRGGKKRKGSQVSGTSAKISVLQARCSNSLLAQPKRPQKKPAVSCSVKKKAKLLVIEYPRGQQPAHVRRQQKA